MSSASEAVRVSSVEAATRTTPEGGYLVASLRGEVRAFLDDQELSLFSVRALSPHAVWLEVHGETNGVRAPRERSGKLWLEWRDLRVGALAVDLSVAQEPEWVTQGRPRPLLCAVTRGPLPELRQLARFVDALARGGAAHPPREPQGGREKIHDKVQVTELLTLFAREQRAGNISSSGGRVCLRIDSVDAAAGTMLLEDTEAPWTAPTVLEVSHLHAVFEVPLAHKPNEGQAIPIPDWVTCRTRRRFRRAAAPSGYQVRFSHPYSKGLSIVAPLLDISRSGLSFSASAADDLLYPGVPVQELLVYQGEQIVARVQGEIRSCRLDSQGGLATIGMAVETNAHGESESLRELLDVALYPSTHTRTTEVWDVHASSGYLNLSGKTPGDFERIRTAFVNTAEKLAQAPHMSSIAYWPSKGQVQATISHFKAYQSTWLVCQLSKRKGSEAARDSRTGIRDMYLRIYETAQADAETRWLLSYVQDLAPGWSRSVHVGIPQRYASMGDGCLVPFRALETDVSEVSVLTDHLRIRVTVADPVVARAAVRDLHRIRPAQYLDALDLTEERLDLAAISAQWREAGLQRRREMLVASIDGVRTALAVAETAEPGVHLYGLLDCVRMYPLRAGGELCFGALLAEARRWFGRMGRERFAYLEEFPVEARELGTTFRDLGGATLTLLSVERIPELLRCVSDLASRRPPPLGALGLPREAVRT